MVWSQYLFYSLIIKKCCLWLLSGKCHSESTSVTIYGCSTFFSSENEWCFPCKTWINKELFQLIKTFTFWLCFRKLSAKTKCVLVCLSFISFILFKASKRLFKAFYWNYWNLWKESCQQSRNWTRSDQSLELTRTNIIEKRLGIGMPALKWSDMIQLLSTAWAKLFYTHQ